MHPFNYPTIGRFSFQSYTQRWIDSTAPSLKKPKQTNKQTNKTKAIS